MANRKLQGRWGEEKAAEFLRKRGYKIIALGFQTRMGEIDIIAENRHFLAFVEVKMRKSDRFASAAEAVDGKKQRRLTLAALQWIQNYPTAKQPRFDVIEVYAPDGMATVNPQINYIENAFDGAI